MNNFFSCPYEGCLKLYLTKKGYIYHLKEKHLIEGSFSCDQCPKTFVQRSALENHKRAHALAPAFICAVEGCEEAFTNLPALRSHSFLHQKFEPYKCEECGKTFKQRWKVKAHKKRFHTLATYPCTREGCSKVYRYRDSLKAHIRDHHTDREWICPWKSCGQIFLSKSALQYHRESHKVEYEYKCEHPFCDKAYESKRSLIIHQELKEHGSFA